jgi:hypothetical protein
MALSLERVITGVNDLSDDLYSFHLVIHIKEETLRARRRYVGALTALRLGFWWGQMVGSEDVAECDSDAAARAACS